MSPLPLETGKPHRNLGAPLFVPRLLGFVLGQTHSTRLRLPHYDENSHSEKRGEKNALIIGRNSISGLTRFLAAHAVDLLII